MKKIFILWLLLIFNFGLIFAINSKKIDYGFYYTKFDIKGLFPSSYYCIAFKTDYLFQGIIFEKQAGDKYKALKLETALSKRFFMPVDWVVFNEKSLLALSFINREIPYVDINTGKKYVDLINVNKFFYFPLIKNKEYSEISFENFLDISIPKMKFLIMDNIDENLCGDISSAKLAFDAKGIICLYLTLNLGKDIVEYLEPFPLIINKNEKEEYDFNIDFYYYSSETSKAKSIRKYLKKINKELEDNNITYKTSIDYYDKSGENLHSYNVFVYKNNEIMAKLYLEQKKSWSSIYKNYIYDRKNYAKKSKVYDYDYINKFLFVDDKKYYVKDWQKAIEVIIPLFLEDYKYF